MRDQGLKGGFSTPGAKKRCIFENLYSLSAMLAHVNNGYFDIFKPYSINPQNKNITITQCTL